MSDIYLQITETPTVVTLSAPVVSGALASTVTVANTVTVALDSNSLSALENVTVTVGAAVSISNFPSTQTIAGTVTANVPLVDVELSGGVTQGIPVYLAGGKDGVVIDEINYINNILGTVTIAGTVTANPTGTQTIAGSVTLGASTAQIGSVTASVSNTNFSIKAVVALDGSTSAIVPTPQSSFRLYTPVGASKTLNNIFGANPAWITPYSDVISFFSDSGVQNDYFHDGTQWLREDFVTPAGTDALNGSFITFNLGAESSISLSNGFTFVQLDNPLVSNSSMRVSLYNSSVTAKSSNGSLTTRFGSVTTANTAFATSAVTNANRKYLLIQNVTTASNVITVGIGFTPTTTQGIQLSSGAGLTFEGNYIPTGAVNLLSSVTASCFTILEA